MRWVLALACLAACSDPYGLTIVIATPPNTSAVRVFVADRHCELDDKTMCTSIQPPDFTAPRIGTGLLLDSSASATYKLTGDNELVFRLESPYTGDAFAKKIVLLAIDGTGLPTGSRVLDGRVVPVGTSETISVEMDPYSPPTDPETDQDDGDHVLFWPRADNAAAGCLLISQVHNKQETYTFVVPEDDFDCDDQPKPECRVFWANAPPVPGHIPACLLRDPVRSDACMLGGPLCSEDEGMTDPCALLATRYCVTDEICDKCPNPGNLASCGQQLGAGLTNMTIEHLSFGFPTDQTLLLPCSGSAAEVEMDVSQALLRSGGDGSCRRALLHDISATFGTPPFTQVATATIHPPFPGNLVMGMQVTRPDPCTVRLTWQSGMAPNNAANIGLLMVDLEAPSGHLVIPARIRFEANGCNLAPMSRPVLLGTSTCLSP